VNAQCTDIERPKQCSGDLIASSPRSPKWVRSNPKGSPKETPEISGVTYAHTG